MFEPIQKVHVGASSSDQAGAFVVYSPNLVGERAHDGLEIPRFFTLLIGRHEAWMARHAFPSLSSSFLFLFFFLSIFPMQPLRP